MQKEENVDISKMSIICKIRIYFHPKGWFALDKLFYL